MGVEMAKQTVRDVMTKDPVTVPPTATLAQAAQAMSARDIGDVLVVENGKIRSVLTDRDIVVRAVAQGRDPTQTPVSEAASTASVTVSPDEPVEKAVHLMREHKVRRLPVVDQDRVVGVVSLGDLAANRDPDSVLADISEAPPNT
jgi:CBS domain-containing protein